MRRYTRYLIVLFVIPGLLTSGCATIISGTSQAITINSTPAGAKIVVGPLEEKTPATLWVPKGKDYLIKVTHDSQTKQRILERRFDAAGLLNLLFWPGFIIDAVTGAMTLYEPATYNFDFTD